MLEKYKATIHGDTIEWENAVPDEIAKDEKLEVYVTRVRDPKTTQPNGERAVEIMQRIADRGGIRSIPDPYR